MEKNNIKIIKLVNGDDILCHLPEGATQQLPEDSPLIRLVKPFQIRYVPSITPHGIKDYIAMQKWAGYSNDAVITIPKNKIMTVTNASKAFTDSYHNLQKHYHKMDHPIKPNFGAEGPSPQPPRLSDGDNRKLNDIFEDIMEQIDEEDPTIH